MHPGLIIDVFNWIRPRDTSHYERFRHYHDTFYRHVEATSVTPFSARARDRALPAVLAAYVRLADEGVVVRSRRCAVPRRQRRAPRASSEILAARAYDATNRDDVRVETELQLRNLIDELGPAGRATYDPSSSTPARGVGNGKTTRREAEPASVDGAAGRRGCWPVAGSLREVEPEVDVVLRDADGI